MARATRTTRIGRDAAPPPPAPAQPSPGGERQTPRRKARVRAAEVEGARAGALPAATQRAVKGKGKPGT